ncbi:MAG TPA: SRPBCC domain-containing protein [Acidimicrobiales bacterium]|nr:SRPBCC domain-containing protein [Acidimicrobiales bacterium]
MGPVLDSIVVERQLAAPVGRVWEWWTDEERVRSWFAPAARVGAEPGEPYELFWEPDHPERNSTAGCRVLDSAPTERLAFEWKGPEEHAAVMNLDPPPTAVLVTFTALDQELTQVRVEHTGWGEGPEWEAARTWHVQAWEGVLGQLENQLGRPGDRPATA